MSSRPFRAIASTRTPSSARPGLARRTLSWSFSQAARSVAASPTFEDHAAGVALVGQRRGLRLEGDRIADARGNLLRTRPSPAPALPWAPARPRRPAAPWPGTRRPARREDPRKSSGAARADRAAVAHVRASVLATALTAAIARTARSVERNSAAPSWRTMAHERLIQRHRIAEHDEGDRLLRCADHGEKLLPLLHLLRRPPGEQRQDQRARRRGRRSGAARPGS